MTGKLLPAVALLLFACSDSTGPAEGRIPELGSYDYSITIPAVPGVIGAREYQGTMTITFASPDSLAGHWSVTGYSAALSGGFWNEGAYVVNAQSGSGLMVHRLEPSATGLTCDDSGLLVATGQPPTGFTRVDGVCALQLRVGQ